MLVTRTRRKPTWRGAQRGRWERSSAASEDDLLSDLRSRLSNYFFEAVRSDRPGLCDEGFETCGRERCAGRIPDDVGQTLRHDFPLLGAQPREFSRQVLCGLERGLGPGIGLAACVAERGCFELVK